MNPRLSALLVIAWLALPGGAAAQQSTAYPLDEVIDLLKAGASTAVILSTVRVDCISFRVQAATAELRRAGADDTLIRGLGEICTKLPARAVSGGANQRSTREMGVVWIEGELPPGWMRQVNVLPPSTERQIEMTAGRHNVVTVFAPGWCPFTSEMSVEAREEKRWTPILRPRPWVGGCPGENEP